MDAITINTAKRGKDARQDAKLTHMSDKAVKQAKEKISTAIRAILYIVCSLLYMFP